MPPKKQNSSLDRVLGRLDQLDSVNLTNLVQRLARERGLFEDIFNTSCPVKPCGGWSRGYGPPWKVR